MKYFRLFQADQEESAHKRLSDLLKLTETEDFSNSDRDLNQVHELIKVRIFKIFFYEQILSDKVIIIEIINFF